MALNGQKVAVLMESDFYEPEILYYQRRFAEEGAEAHFLTRLWGNERLVFRATSTGCPSRCPSPSRTWTSTRSRSTPR